MAKRIRPYTEAPEVSTTNSKLHDLAERLGIPHSRVCSFDLPAGWTCPGACDCLARSDRITGKVSDGPAQRFRCYAASAEAYSAEARNLRWHNFKVLAAASHVPEDDRKLHHGGASASARAMARTIESGIPKRTHVLRIHSSGDFFNREYLNAWILVARAHPEITFYGYTKCAHWLPARASLPENMRLIVSAGGRFDECAPDYPRCYVCHTHTEAQQKFPELPVYTTAESELACMRGDSYVLLVHGTQPAR